MSLLLFGKGLETLGAVLLAYVGGRAAWLELDIGRHLQRQGAADPAKNADTDAGSPRAGCPLHRQKAVSPQHGELESLRAGLQVVLERRQKQFGFYEIVIVGVGTFLIAVGCILYVAGLIAQPH